MMKTMEKEIEVDIDGLVKVAKRYGVALNANNIIAIWLETGRGSLYMYRLYTTAGLLTLYIDMKEEKAYLTSNKEH